MERTTTDCNNRLEPLQEKSQYRNLSRRRLVDYLRLFFLSALASANSALSQTIKAGLKQINSPIGKVQILTNLSMARYVALAV